MVSKEEIRIWKVWQFFDKHGFFPFEKIRIDITLSAEALEKMKNKNRSEFIENLILEN
jgi:hypothetical protein